jgi:hypothetical protein
VQKFILPVIGLLVTGWTAWGGVIAVGGTRGWQQKAAFFNEDTYFFSYTTGSPLLKITQIDVKIGDGVTPTLFTDPTAGAPGYMTFGFGSLGGTAAGAATITDSLVDGDGTGSATFAPGWLLGQTFSFSVDTDHDGTGSCNILCMVGRDFVTGTEFNDYGGISFTLHFGVTQPGLSIVGPNTVTVPNGGWTTILNNSIIPSMNSVSGDWEGRIEVVPEPGNIVLVSAGLGLLLLGRRHLG